jgi:hypothetical protein
MEHERNKIIIKSISPLMARKTDWRCSTMDHRSPSPSPLPSESHFLIVHQKNGKKRLINRTSLKALLGDMIMVTFKNIFLKYIIFIYFLKLIFNINVY